MTGTADGPSKFSVRLVGTADVKDVRWQKMIRIVGPDLFVSQAVQNSGLHGLQRFLVESIYDWRVETDDTAKVLIKWQGYGESERTWEPLAQVYEDVSVITKKYVTEVNNETLTETLDQVEESSSSENDTSDDFRVRSTKGSTRDLQLNHLMKTQS